MLRPDRGPQEADQAATPTWSTSSPSCCSVTSTTSNPLPEADAQTTDIEVRRTLLGARRVEVQRGFSRSSAEAHGTSPAPAHRHPPRAQHLVDRALLADLPRDPGDPAAERRVLRRDHRGDLDGGGQIRVGGSLLPVQGGAGPHPQPAVSPPQPGKTPPLHLQPDHHPHPLVREERPGLQLLSHRPGLAERAEGRLHQGGRLLRPAGHHLPRRGGLLDRAAPAAAADAGPVRQAPRHHRGREPLRLRAGLRGPAQAGRRDGGQGAGPARSRSRRKTGWPSCSSPGPTTSTPG